MIPIGDADVRRGTFPVINIALISISILVFLYEISLSGLDQHIFILKNGLIPAELTGGPEFTRVPTHVGFQDIVSPLGTWPTLFTSMFIHGGFMHIIGNMLFLWVFGDNIENRLGHVKYLAFYLGVGLAASWTQVVIEPNSQAPLIGASGAIAGVLGAYLLMYPFNHINTLVIFYFITFVRLPAVYVLGFWFILQLFQGLVSLGPQIAGAGNVAYFAHIGGFVAGLVMMAGYKLIARQQLIPRRSQWNYRA